MHLRNTVERKYIEFEMNERFQINFVLLSILLVILFISPSLSYGQISAPTYAQTPIFDSPVSKDTVPDWQLQFIGSLNGNQAAYSNWSQGGVNSLAMTASTVFNAAYAEKKFGYQLGINLKYGQTRLQKHDIRKTDDQILMKNQINYNLTKKVLSLFGAVIFQTQFDKGYDYQKGPPYKLISRFFAPAYITESTGLLYRPVKYFSVQGGFGMKQTIIRDTTLSVHYGLRSGRKLMTEGGISLEVQFNKEIFKNVSLSSGFVSFTSFLKPFRSTDFSFANELSGKINSFMNADFQFVAVYNDNVTKAIQIKQVLALGLSFRFL